MRGIFLGFVLFCATLFSAEFVVPATSGDKVTDIPGVVYSKNEASLASKSGGFVKTILVEEGEKVKTGQTLFEIDQNEAIAMQAASKASLDEATKNLTRYRSLFEKGVISQSELEKAEVNFASKKAAFAQSENSIKYAVVKAPFSGIVVKKNGSVGTFVNAGQPIIILQSDRDLRFKASVGEAQVKNLTLNMTVSIIALGKTFEAKIASITNSSAMNYEIKADFAKPDGLTPGLYATLQSKVGDENGFNLPPSVLTKRGGVIGVFTNVNGVAKFYPIKIVQERADSVLASGVKAGMKLIVSPKVSLNDGEKVQ
ncbi:MAG: hypothetical protein RL154_1643 [Pseudomonadota bacterium]|jgi:RND family efflux transporter MFP subunit